MVIICNKVTCREQCSKQVTPPTHRSVRYKTAWYHYLTLLHGAHKTSPKGECDIAHEAHVYANMRCKRKTNKLMRICRGLSIGLCWYVFIFSLPPLTLRNPYLVDRSCLPLMLPLWAALWRTSSDCKEAWMSHRKEQQSHQQPGQVDFRQVHPTNVDIQNRARRWVTTCNNQRKPPCGLSWTPSLGILWWPLGAFTLAAFEKRTRYDFQLLVKYSHNTYWHFKHKFLFVYEGGKLTPGWRQHTYTCKYASTWESQWI